VFDPEKDFPPLRWLARSELYPVVSTISEGAWRFHGNGAVLNLWEAKPEFAKHPFEVYEVGLHHIAFYTDTREQVDRACELAKRLGAKVLDGPGEFPYGGPDGWYAVYFLGPDRMKFEVVHMPGAEKRYNEMMRALERGSS